MTKEKCLLYAVVGVVLMFGFGFALVPLYNVLCTVTGLNGKTGGRVPLSQVVDPNRTVMVEFVAHNNASLPWTFYPVTKKISIHPGENKRIIFFAENNSPHSMIVQAIPSVTPREAAPFLKKTECFCFTQQRLAAGKALDMPVVFHLDPDLPKEITTLTLAYTLFAVGGK